MPLGTGRSNMHVHYSPSAPRAQYIKTQNSQYMQTRHDRTVLQCSVPPFLAPVVRNIPRPWHPLPLLLGRRCPIFHTHASFHASLSATMLAVLSGAKGSASSTTLPAQPELQ